MKKYVIKDANQACARVAYKFSDVSAIYPITPSSPMAEYCDEMLLAGEKNLFEKPLTLVEMQSEAGAAAAMHGSLIEGALTTTFTASQGLLLMIPNMYKMAGEQLPAVMHVSARALATHALSIFGDHSDVMAVRPTGFAMLCSNNAQEAQDMAAIAHMSAIKSSLPFLHFFDGFRTSHEIQKFEELSDEEMLKLLPKKEVQAFKNRALNPQKPAQAGTAQNPDVFFQNREASNVKYNNLQNCVITSMEEFEKVSGRKYQPFEYVGDKNAEYVVALMGSACDTVEDFILKLQKTNCEEARKFGLLKVRMFRPFSAEYMLNVLPKTTKKIAVLDRTKESGALGEPLYLDISTAIKNSGFKIDVVGGRYGLGSKEFDSENVASVFENLLAKNGKNNFTVGIIDDLTNLSLPKSEELNKYYQNESKSDYEMLFYGLGSDGTVSANKNSIKMIGSQTDKFVQGYFEYDSKKSGSLTVSHLRVSSEPIKKIYEVKNADFIAIHNFSFLNRFNILERLATGGIVLLNTVLTDKELNDNLPNYFKKALIEKKAKLYIINAGEIARRHGLGNKINVVMQSAFFNVSQIIDFNKFLEEGEKAVRKTYGRKGEEVVSANINALLEGKNTTQIDLSNLDFNEQINELEEISPKALSDEKNEFVENIMKPITFRKGNEIPVSKFSADGFVPTDTAKFEKRGIAEFLPCWKSENCIQCGRCALVCPHAAIRAINANEDNITDAPEEFITLATIGSKGNRYRIQVSPLDCTGCGVCASVCPAKQKALEMVSASQILEKEKTNYAYSENVKTEKTIFSKFTTKGNQFERPLFEFNGACAGCGETPYIKLATTLFGENMIVANATGCSSIYGGSFPSCPYAKNSKGFGPAWANSLFEDNAEFGLGIAVASKTKKSKLKDLILNVDFEEDNEIKNKFLNDQNSLLNEEAEKIIEKLLKNNKKIENIDEIIELKDEFFKKSIWIIGGDGWAYDIGYGGLDHILNSGENVNILVLDTEVYSNTGGQASKSTSRGAVAKFASNGKTTKKKDLGTIAIAGNSCYVAKVAMGANYEQTIKAFKEAEEFNGPSLIIAYAPCVAHGINMSKTQEEMNRAVKSGYFELYRYNPETQKLILDSDEPTMDFEEFLKGETRFSATMKADPERAKILFEEAKKDAIRRREFLKKLI